MSFSFLKCVVSIILLHLHHDLLISCCYFEGTFYNIIINWALLFQYLWIIVVRTHINSVVQFPHEGEAHWWCDIWRISIFCVYVYFIIPDIISIGKQISLCGGNNRKLISYILM